MSQNIPCKKKTVETVGISRLKGQLGPHYSIDSGLERQKLLLTQKKIEASQHFATTLLASNPQTFWDCVL